MQTERTAQLADRDRAARSAAQQVRAWRLRRDGSSQILNCVAALADDATAPGHFLAVTDLADNAGRGQQVGSVDLNGATVSVIQSCPADATTLCPLRLATFRGWVAKHHGHLGAVMRADDMSAAVATWLDVTR